MSSEANPSNRPAMGWREWVALPELGVESIKAKIDTGARTSSLHAFNLHYFDKDGHPYVRFEVHPRQGSDQVVINAEARLLEYRLVRSSNGQAEDRPVIQTTIRWGTLDWEIELTLANRDSMGFRMLLGREALRARVTIDPDRSFLGGRRKKKKKPPKDD